MDKIELVVTHDAGGPVSRYWSAIFGMAGGTVGRAGQNKLVLPDDDAMVARVHAMVRLDSDQAYIANLCERRSVHVNGREVLSGQEVPLVPGTSVGIGPYQLRAVIPGQHSNLQATPAKVSCTRTEGISESASAVGTSAQPVTSIQGANASASAIDLASLPNPWADIPVIEGEDPHLSGLLLSSLPKAPSQHVTDSGAAEDNPFAMLGRVEASSAATLVPEQCPSERGPTSAMTVADRIHVSAGVNEYHVVMERTRPRDFEVYNVLSVTGHQEGQVNDREFVPLYASVHGIRSDDQAYFAVRREPRLFSEHVVRYGPRTQYLGSEVFLSLVDQRAAPFSDDLKQLSVRTLCTNRDLPLLMPINQAEGDFITLDSAPIGAIRTVAGPSRPMGSVAENEITWRLISHPDRCGRPGWDGRCGQPAQTSIGPWSAAHDWRHHLGRVQEVHRERPGADAPLPAGTHPRARRTQGCAHAARSGRQAGSASQGSDR